jgi:hypothetical protein
MRVQFIPARDLPDAWFQCVSTILNEGSSRKFPLKRCICQNREK